MARQEGVAIVDAGREEVTALENDAAQRVADLDTEHQELTHRLGVMETTYDELLATLKLSRLRAVESLAGGLPRLRTAGFGVVYGIKAATSSPAAVATGL